MLEKCKDLNFKFLVPRIPPSLLSLFRPKYWKSILTGCRPECIFTEPQNRHKSEHFDKIIKQVISLVKHAYTELNTRRLWRITYFFQFFLMNNKLVTAVLCFGSHFCNQAARIRVNLLSRRVSSLSASKLFV